MKSKNLLIDNVSIENFTVNGYSNTDPLIKKATIISHTRVRWLILGMMCFMDICKTLISEYPIVLKN